MRLWHKSLISVLPRRQLVAQLRECVLIARNIYEGKTKIHCLINPLFNYPISHFVTYTYYILQEFERRDFKVRKETINKLNTYLDFDKYTIFVSFDELFKNWHNYAYLHICYFNLLEKYKCNNIDEYEWSQIDNCFNHEKQFALNSIIEQCQRYNISFLSFEAYKTFREKFAFDEKYVKE